jgi:4-amino-4-deoxy-L-arabinose transferase-like glycosyltransferase
MWERLRQHQRLLRRVALAAVILLYLGYALWGIAAPLAWGHYGFHAGFHGAAARNLVRHGEFTPTPHVGQSPPPPSARYLHHPILCPQYLVPVQAVLGDEEWTIRLVPVLFTLALILAVAWAGRRLWGPWAGVLAALVFTLLPHNMVFCHLYDHETPGNLYALLGVCGLLLGLAGLGTTRSARWGPELPRTWRGSATGGRWRHGWGPWVLTLGGFLAAGLTDWPPYFIAFAVAWAALGYLLVATAVPQRPARVWVWLAGLIPLVGATAWLLARKAGWPPWQVAVGLFLLWLGALWAGAAVPAEPRRPWRALLARWGLLAALSAVVLFTFWFHFRYTAWVGMGEDLDTAFRVRSAGSDAWRHLGKYARNVQHTFTTPMLWVGGLWLASLPVRLAVGRPRLRALLPLVFATGQILHNLQFPGEVDIHNYRTYYFVIAATFVFVDLAWEGEAAGRWLISRFSRVSGVGVGVAAAPAGGSSAMTARTIGLRLGWGGALGAVLLWVGLSAWPVLAEGRRRSGTLRYFAGYHHQLDKARAFDEVRRRTDPETLVLYTPGVAPRFEALWYLDRDVRKVFSLPPGREAALRWASRPRWPRRRGGVRRRRPETDRDVVAITTARVTRRTRRRLRRLRRRYAMVRLGAYLLVDYRRRGPDYRAYRIEPRPWRGLLERWLRGPHRPRRLVRDLWNEWRTASYRGLPLSGRPVLTRPPPPSGRRADWVAWLNARRVAGDAAGQRAARAALQRRLRGQGPYRLSPELRLLGWVPGHTLVELVVEARRTHRPRCRLQLEARGGLTWRFELFPRLRRWPAGAVYVARVPYPRRHRPPGPLRLSRCGGKLDPVKPENTDRSGGNGEPSQASRETSDPVITLYPARRPAPPARPGRRSRR